MKKDKTNLHSKWIYIDQIPRVKREYWRENTSFNAKSLAHVLLAHLWHKIPQWNYAHFFVFKQSEQHSNVSDINKRKERKKWIFGEKKIVNWKLLKGKNKLISKTKNPVGKQRRTLVQCWARKKREHSTVTVFADNISTEKMYVKYLSHHLLISGNIFPFRSCND